MGVVIKAIRDSARGEPCMSCNMLSDTVVFAHGPRLGMAGVGQKVDDQWGAFLCDHCHYNLDQHRYSAMDEMAVWMRAIAATQRRLYEKGIMQFPERAKQPKTVNKVMPRKPSWRTSA